MTITRRVFGASAAALLAAPALVSAAEARGRVLPPSIDPATLLDPEIRPIVERMAAQFGNRTMTAGDLPRIRAMSRSFAPKPLAAPPLIEKTIPGPAGAPDVNILVTGQQSDGKLRPAVLDIHGGGYILGSMWDEAVIIQQLASELDCVAVTVDYRLAPETRYPGSLEDNYTALRWIYTNADALGVDRTRIAVMGGSAGGGHAAALAIAARDRKEIPLCCQILIYPMLDDRTGSKVKPPSFIGTYVWTASENRLGWTSLLGVPAGSRRVPKGAVPARVADLAGLPPTFIGVGDLDLFANEDMEYARRLVEFGVPTKLLVVPGAVHGFDRFAPESRIAKEFTASWHSELALHLGASA